MSTNETGFGERLPVRGASHACVSFDVASPNGAELTIDHFCAGQLLACEHRPLPAGANSLAFKTHPDASHIACSLRPGKRTIDGVRFKVDCGECIEPAGRNFIVIGAMKAGTTTLFELLAQHPALCRTWVEVPGLSFTKEINYFRRLYRTGDTPLHYDWRFPFAATRHAWTLDVSPSYAKPGSKAVPARIASLGQTTKLAYILREPIERIESHVAHAMHKGHEITNLQHCINTSRYARYLDQFLARFDRDDLLLLDFEQLRQDPGTILAQICDFLEIERFAGRTAIHNTGKIEFRLDAAQREEVTEALRPDVERLISVYGFKPAEEWLRRPVSRRPPALRQ